MTGLPTLGPRGEGWVVAQFVLLALTALAGTLGPAWGEPLRIVTTLGGLTLIAAGGALAARGLLDLREALTPLPHPRDGAELVEHGAYRLARHPIYGGLVLGAAGYGLVMASPAALVGALALAGLFDLKSRVEERWLAERHPGYDAYRARTRRLIPWVY